MINANMELSDEIEQLRLHLDDLAGPCDDELARYGRWQSPMPTGFYWRMRWLAGRVLRWLESMRLRQPDPWPVGLKHAGRNARAKPLIIWGVGTDRYTLRAACDGFIKLSDGLPGFAPVLVTDVPDFAFYSRLGWLVEYLPTLRGDGPPYEERKARFIARLYRGAPALPVRAGLASESQALEIKQWVHNPTQSRTS